MDSLNIALFTSTLLLFFVKFQHISSPIYYE
jgi:hypothetical protein